MTVLSVSTMHAIILSPRCQSNGTNVAGLPGSRPTPNNIGIILRIICSYKNNA